MGVRIISEKITDRLTIDRRVTDTGATVENPDLGALVVPAALHRLPKVSNPYLDGLGQFAASQYGGTLAELVKDAAPVEGGYLYAWRPVEEYGAGCGSGFSKGWELLTVGNALSNLWHEVNDGRKTWADFELHGVTAVMVADTRRVYSDACAAYRASLEA
ncbi:hypothetical protein [Streptomyces sp. IBSBF 2950]|uniref:hypothetical protein n=1 Tax=Streptomyces sp. IBSBF 2950 TaxID=2903528 RepID=UPI002FDC6C23